MKKLLLSAILGTSLMLGVGAGAAFADGGGTPHGGSCGIGSSLPDTTKFDGTNGASTYANANQSNPSNDFPPPSQGYLAGCVGN